MFLTLTFNSTYIPNYIRHSSPFLAPPAPPLSLQDMRVLTFEDRHDCMHCLTLLHQWPQYEYHKLEMAIMRTEVLEAEIEKSWILVQEEQGWNSAESGAARARGLVRAGQGTTTESQARHLGPAGPCSLQSGVLLQGAGYNWIRGLCTLVCRAVQEEQGWNSGKLGAMAGSGQTQPKARHTRWALLGHAPYKAVCCCKESQGHTCFMGL